MDEGNGFSNAGNTSMPGANPGASAPRPTDESIADTGMSGEVTPTTPATQPTGIYTSNFAPAQPVTEDLVIKPSSPKGRSRRPKWLAPVIIVVVGALLVGGVFLLMNFLNNRPAPATLESTFVRFQKLLIEGPDGIELNEEVETTEPETTEPETETEVGESEATDDGTGDNAEGTTEEREWFIFNSSEFLTAEERLSYYDNLKSSYQDFINALESSSANSDNPELAQYASAYGNSLNILIYMLGIDITDTAIEAEYLSEGRDSAIELINQQISELEASDAEHLVKTISDIDSYLLSQVDLLAIYSENGCLVDGIMEATCISDLADSENQAYMDAFNNRELAYYNFDASLAMMENMFLAQTSNLEAMVGNRNA